MQHSRRLDHLQKPTTQNRQQAWCVKTAVFWCWYICSLLHTGIDRCSFFTQGRRLGHGVWKDGKFLGCLSPPDGKSEPGLRMPIPWVEHCTLNEGYNLQVTRPHLDWHFSFLQQLRTGTMKGEEQASLHVVHWPGRPKPWKLAFGQRSEFEQHWWRLHADLCIANEDMQDKCKLGSAAGQLHGCDASALASDRETHRHAGQCWMRCG